MVESIPSIQDGVSEVKNGLQEVKQVVNDQDIKVIGIIERLVKDERTIESVVGKVDKTFEQLNKGLNDLQGKVNELSLALQSGQSSTATLSSAIGSTRDDVDQEVKRLRGQNIIGSLESLAVCAMKS